MPSAMKLALAGAAALFSALHVNAAAWEARHGLTRDQFQKTYDVLEANNYSLVDVSGYTENNSPRFAGIFIKHDNKPDVVARGEVDAKSYPALFSRLRAEGYRPKVVDGYTVNDNTRFTTIWDKSSKTPWEERTGMSANGFQRVFDHLVKKEGYRLTYVSGYAEGKEARYAAIWEKSNKKTEWVARFGLTSKRYQEEFDKNLKHGLRPVHVNGYSVDGKAYFAAIWEKSNSVFEARHGLTAQRYQETFDALVKKGYVLSVVSGYEDGGCVRYAAIWNKE
ncbi:WD40 domain-containing protein [Histoplasma capsulatum H143]|uniref:WD40 domain-containing protein n=1 Tax=Ajellomyces capsulatus (strain H143) TaxID=544712 RepID=C6H3H4_AJECH|nr:WD40 domain-containing protein [Histoplasma capsulatum H143]